MKVALVKNIRLHMSRKRLNISEMERDAGVKRGAFYNIISGRSVNPTLDTLTSLANVLDCSISELINDKPEANLTENFKDEQYNPWNSLLFNNVVQKVLSSLKEKKLNPKFEQVLSIIREAYIFSLTENSTSNKPNELFIEWIVKKGIDLYKL